MTPPHNPNPLPERRHAQIDFHASPNMVTFPPQRRLAEVMERFRKRAELELIQLQDENSELHIMLIFRHFPKLECRFKHQKVSQLQERERVLS